MITSSDIRAEGTRPHAILRRLRHERIEAKRLARYGRAVAWVTPAADHLRSQGVRP